MVAVDGFVHRNIFLKEFFKGSIDPNFHSALKSIRPFISLVIATTSNFYTDKNLRLDLNLLRIFSSNFFQIKI